MQGNTTMYLPYKSAHGAVAADHGDRRAHRADRADLHRRRGHLSAGVRLLHRPARHAAAPGRRPGLEETLLEWVYEDFMEQLNADACAGAGSGSQSLAGIFAASATYLTCLSGSAGAIANTVVSHAVLQAAVQVPPEREVVPEPLTLAVAMGFTMPNLINTPLVQPNATDGSFSILGKPVVEVDDAPAIGATKLPHRAWRPRGGLRGRHPQAADHPA